MLRTPNWSAPRSEWSADRMSTQGTCEPRFERVREEFERNFAERGEVGASVCVTLDGQTVVDLWGGTARPDQPWAQDTIGNVWSATKDRKSTRLNSSHVRISYAVFCLKKKKK